MSVIVPPSHPAALLQAEITALAARTDTFSQNLLKQRQEHLVSTLLAEGKLNAALILSTVPFNPSKNPQAAAIAKYTALVASYGGSAPAVAAAQSLDQAQQKAVAEMFESGALPAAAVLSTMTYIGG